LELIGAGEQAANWGNTANHNLGTLLEQAIAGVQSVAVSGASYTLTTGSGVADEARNAVLVLTGTLAASCNVIVPSVDKTYTFRNATTGGFNVVVKTAAGLGVTITNGFTQQVYCDATDVVAAGVPFNPATGYPWELCEPPRTVSGVAQADFSLPTRFRRYRLTVQDGVVNTTAQSLLLRFSSDGGATFLSAASYQLIGNATDGSAVNNPYSSASNTSIALSAALPASSSNSWDGTFEINPGSVSLSARVRGLAIGVSSTPAWVHGYYGGAWGGTGARMNAIRILVLSGNLSGTFILEGML
jgi:hypothetical protein